MVDDLRPIVDAAVQRGLAFEAADPDSVPVEITNGVLAVVQPELDRLRAACRSAAVLLRATADHRPDPATLRAAARDLDEVAGPEPTQPTTEE